MFTLGLGPRMQGEHKAALALDLGLMLLGVAAALLVVFSGTGAGFGSDPSAIVTALTSVS